MNELELGTGNADSICTDKKKQNPEVCYAGTTGYHDAKVKYFYEPRK